MIFLDRNENLYGPAPKCFEILRSLGVEELSAYSRDYQRGVKSGLAERLAGELNVPEPQILLSEGSEEMLKQVIHCYVGQGEKLLCPSPSWWYYQAVASEVGGETSTYHLKEENGRFSYDADDLISACRREKPRVVLIASPNNPTGHGLPDTDLRRLLEACGDSVIVLDEAYWGFSDEQTDQTAQMALTYPNVLVMRTFSKYFALAGARIAYAAAGANLKKLSILSSRYLGWNRISEALALAALDSREYYQSTKMRIISDRKRMTNFFNAIPGFHCFPSEANFVLVRIPPLLKQPLREILQQQGIVIKFFADDELPNYVRITIGRSKDIDLLLEVIGACVKNSAG